MVASLIVTVAVEGQLANQQVKNQVSSSNARLTCGRLPGPGRYSMKAASPGAPRTASCRAGLHRNAQASERSIADLQPDSLPQAITEAACCCVPIDAHRHLLFEME